MVVSSCTSPKGGNCESKGSPLLPQLLPYTPELPGLARCQKKVIPLPLLSLLSFLPLLSEQEKRKGDSIWCYFLFVASMSGSRS